MSGTVAPITGSCPVPLTIAHASAPSVIATFYIFSAAANAGLWVLLVIGLVNSGVAAYYYLRVLATLYMRPEAPGITYPRPRPASAVALAALSIMLLVFGVYPAPLVAISERAAAAASPIWGQW